MTNNILIVDSNQAFLQTLTSLFKSQGGFLNVHAATSGRQALILLKKLNVRIVITAIRIPEVDGFELVTRLSREYPQVKVIVMTSNARPLLRAKISGLPSAVHFDQTQDFSMLTSRVFTELQIDYGGRVRGINLSSFLQMMELESKSCTLKVTSKDKTGYLWMKNGELIAARTRTATGKDAALKIIAWKNVFIDIDYSPHQAEQEIFLPLMMLILESGQMDDEIQSSRQNKRRHERYDLLVALDYNIKNIKNIKRHCSLRDISTGGAYIETDQRIEIGEKITLTFTSPALNSSCTVDAKVVRQDEQGVGIVFQLHSVEQQNMIKALLKGSLNTVIPDDSTAPAFHAPTDGL